MTDSVQQLRDKNQPQSALKKLLQQLAFRDVGSGQRSSLEADQRRPLLWWRHISRGRSLLLDYGRTLRTNPLGTAVLEQFVAESSPARVMAAMPDSQTSHTPSDRDGWNPLEFQIELIRLALLDKELSENEIQNRLLLAIEKLAEFWGYQSLASFTELLDEPRFYRCLPSERDRRIFQFVALHLGHDGKQNPAWLMAGELWNWLLDETSGDLPIDPQHPSVETWVLFADQEEPGGVMARLTIERVPKGTGAVYPHPLHAGLIRTDVAFQRAIQNAWLAVVAQPQITTFDFRWKLDFIIDDEQIGQLLNSPVEGQSAEAAFAIALWAAAPSEPFPLERGFAVTAILGNVPQVREVRESFDFRELELRHVNAVMDKALAKPLKRFSITEIVVASGQKLFGKAADGEPFGGQDRIGKFAEVKTFGALLDRVSLDLRWTAQVNRQLAERAKSILEKRCNPYVPSRLGRDPTDQELAQMEPDDARLRKPIPLTSKQTDQIVLARGGADQNRVFLFADSGFGKSMLLVHCEQLIASDGSGRIPVRIGAGPKYEPPTATPSELPVNRRADRQRLPLLSEIPWSNHTETIRRLAAQVCHLLPGARRDEPPTEKQLEWFAKLFRRGDVVLLLDALDQTKQDLDSLASFLAEFPKVAVLLTGRPESMNWQSTVFTQQAWAQVHVLEFDDEQQELFLGDDADLLLLTDEDSGEGKRFKGDEGWKPLLPIPILLHGLRDLAISGQVAEIKSRFDIYERMLGKLIEQGLVSLRDCPRGNARSNSRTVTMDLERIAWETLFRDAASPDDANFTGRIDGRKFDELLAQDGDLLETLAQIDVATLDPLFDDYGFGSLTWRHLSFCEYFAGRYLAHMPHEQRKQQLSRHARSPRWRWVLRFALCALAEVVPNNSDALRPVDSLALDIIRCGNPFVVYRAIRNDQIVLKESVDGLCAHLVVADDEFHHDALDRLKIPGYLFSFRKVPIATQELTGILTDLFRRKHRNSRCLFMAWELLELLPLESSTPIREAFLREARNHLECREIVNTRLTAPETFATCPPHGQPGDWHEFQVGSNKYGPNANEAPIIRRRAQTFAMQRTTVTNTMFWSFDPAHRQEREQYRSECENPVIHVSWFQAVMYCRWLGSEYRLPFEAEWEFACRAGTTTEYHVGDKLYKTQANIRGRGTEVVASYPSNAWGLYDMHGNVGEWCEEWFHMDWYKHLNKSGVTVATLVPHQPDGLGRVTRGGSWRNDIRFTSSASRFHEEPSKRANTIGFRVVFVSTQDVTD